MTEITLDEIQSKIVKLLADGHEEEAIAGRLSMSVEDIKLAIKELCDLFGSHTAAGVVGKALALKRISIYAVSPLPLSA